MAKSKRDLPVVAFKSQQAFDAWLASQPEGSRGLWLKIAKKSSGIISISRDEAVDAALCHGWIDGQLDSFDDDYWLIRFTPRQSTSIWSEKNRARALQLKELGVMRPSGLREIDRARADGRWERAYAGASTAKVPDDLRAALARNKKAAAFFETLDARNRYAILHRTHTAKKPETRAARIAKFVAMLARGETIHPRKVKAAKAPKAGQEVTGAAISTSSCPALSRASTSCFLAARKTWMAGSSPAMTSDLANKNPAISLSFPAFGATSRPVSRPPHPWRLAAS